MRYIQKTLLVIVCGCAVSVNDVRAGHSEEGQKVAEAGLISTADWVLHTEFTLDRPLSEVWPVFRDEFRWYTEYTFEEVSGPSYKAGSGLLEDQVLKLTRVSNSDDAAEQYLFIYQKTIKVAPQREIVVVLSGPVSGWKRYTWFYVWKMTEKAKKTTIFVDAYGEAELERPQPKAEFSEYHDRLTRSWHRSWSEAFANLRKVMDANN